MALDVAEFLWNKFLKSLAELESELSGSTTIPFFDSLKDLMNKIKVVMKKIDIMPEPYCDTIGMLYNLNDALAECRIFTHEYNELNTNLLYFNLPRINFVRKMKSKLNTIKGELLKLELAVQKTEIADPVGTAGHVPPSEVVGSDEQSDPKMGAPQEEISNTLEKIGPKVLPEIFGFVKQSQEIEDLLLLKTDTSSSSADGFTAIGVVGIAGVGKTTVVHKVLESPTVKEKFSPIIWVPFSSTKQGEQQFSRFSFETCILDDLGKTLEARIVGLDNLLKNLSGRLSGKSYLIVLDDVCYQLVNIMERLVSGLPKDSGGAVIVTTRLMDVAQKLGEEQHLIIPVEPLQQDVCSQIFEETIKNDEKLSSISHGESRETLEKIKKEVKDQCHGLPLVAKTLAQIIHESF